MWESKFYGAFHRRDACSMAWWCRFLTTRPSQDGRVIVEKLYPTHWLISTQFDADRTVTEARKRFASEVAAFLDRFNVVRAAVLARLLEASAEHAERRRRASQEVLDDFRGSIGGSSPPSSPSRIAVEAPSRRAEAPRGDLAARRAAAGTVM